jgi:diaminohydroxyphosphoribosylaminopyrimidine deaminase/5-amino-6-(5-phosphoribosylamino)uracil reductase
MSRPHVTLKLATSLDGRIATAAGESQWITGEAARAEVQKLRAGVDAVMIGAGTARADNPSLLARTEPPPAKQPMRVVITRRFDIPFDSHLFEALDQSPLIVFGGERAGPARQAILEGAGARIETAPPAQKDRLSLPVVLSRLRALGVERLLAEGGGELAAALIEEDLVDALEWFRAPVLLGGDARPAIASLALGKLADAHAWRRVALREIGPDLWESYERAR